MDKNQKSVSSVSSAKMMCNTSKCSLWLHYDTGTSSMNTVFSEDIMVRSPVKYAYSSENDHSAMQTHCLGSFLVCILF